MVTTLVHYPFFKKFNLKKIGNRIQSERHEFSYFNYATHAILLEWKKSKSLSVLRKIIQIQSRIEQSNITGLIEMVPAFHSLMIYFRPTEITSNELINHIEDLPQEDADIPESTQTVVIPVKYSTEYGPDQAAVAAHLNISTDTLIEWHSNCVYHVHFIGFLPGFLYLGGLDERLFIPRRENPRVRIPAGSVAIAAGQTGIYPIDSPGGWHIIGHTDYKLFDPNNVPPCPLSPGTRVQFMPV